MSIIVTIIVAAGALVTLICCNKHFLKGLELRVGFINFIDKLTKDEV